MKYFDLKQYSFLTLIIIICLVFLVVVSMAFRYIPQNTAKSSMYDIKNENRVDIDENYSDRENSDYSTGESSYEQSNTDDSYLNSSNDDRNYKEEQVKESNANVNRYEYFVNKAKTEREIGNYSTAEDYYKKAILIASTTEEKAACYDELSFLFAVQGRYGIALTNAESAYNISQTLEREVMLARLYNKTGNYKKADFIVEKIMNRDF